MSLYFLDLFIISYLKINCFCAEMSPFTAHTDIQLFDLIKSGRAEAFDELYDRYWEKLYNYAYHRTRSKDVAFEIVQDIFVSLWSRREVINLQSSLSGYLFASARFQIIGFIRNSKQKEHYLEDYLRFASSSVDNSNEESMMMHDLQTTLERSIDDLPSHCREITRLSVLLHWPVEKISEKLGISHRTVENQLSLARKRLKSSLRDYVMYFTIAGWLS